MVLYVVIRGIVSAATNPLFFDEILTLAVSSQSTVSGIWTALSRSVDGQPPIFYLIERAFTGILGTTQVALRLPSVLSMAGHYGLHFSVYPATTSRMDRLPVHRALDGDKPFSQLCGERKAL